jgi:hypothetical protein
MSTYRKVCPDTVYFRYKNQNFELSRNEAEKDDSADRIQMICKQIDLEEKIKEKIDYDNMLNTPNSAKNYLTIEFLYEDGDCIKYMHCDKNIYEIKEVDYLAERTSLPEFGFVIPTTNLIQKFLLRHKRVQKQKQKFLVRHKRVQKQKQNANGHGFQKHKIVGET